MTPKPSDAAKSTDDRRVHARLITGAEVVRYNRAGKWYLEWDDGRSRIDISDAVALAVTPETEVFFRLPGGSTFDARVRKSRTGEELRLGR